MSSFTPSGSSSGSPSATHPGIFITGTDTGVGKTTVSSALAWALRTHGLERAYWKPVQTGSDSDTDTVRQIAELQPTEWVQPAYHFLPPLAPSRAARIEGRDIEMGEIVRARGGIAFPPSTRLIVEGAGGLLVPLAARSTIRDLIATLRLPMLLVASTRLGTINHTLLSLEAAERAGIEVRGIIWVGSEDRAVPSLEEEIARFSPVPCLGRLPWLKPFSKEALRNHACEIFTPAVLQRIFTSGAPQ